MNKFTKKTKSYDEDEFPMTAKEARHYELTVMALAVWQLRNYCLVTGKTIMEIDSIREFKQVCDHPCGFPPRKWLLP